MQHVCAAFQLKTGRPTLAADHRPMLNPRSWADVQKGVSAVLRPFNSVPQICLNAKACRPSPST